MVSDNCYVGQFASDFPTSWWTGAPSIASVSWGDVTGNSAGNTYNYGSGLLQIGDGEDVTPPHQCPIQSANESGGVGVVPCPSTVSISSTTQEDLSKVLNQYKTGVGINTMMLVGPPGTGYNGAIVTETLTTISNDCPLDIYQCEHPGSHTFTVGLVGPFTLTDGTRIPGQPNMMQDEHVSVSDVSQLDHDGINSCTAVCQQTYSCAGNSLSPSFRITRSYTKGTLNGQAVTNVSVTKSPM